MTYHLPKEISYFSPSENWYSECVIRNWCTGAAPVALGELREVTGLRFNVDAQCSYVYRLAYHVANAEFVRLPVPAADKPRPPRPRRHTTLAAIHKFDLSLHPSNQHKKYSYSIVRDMVLGRFFHYAVDAALLSTMVAGIRRSSGFRCVSVLILRVLATEMHV